MSADFSWEFGIRVPSYDALEAIVGALRREPEVALAGWILREPHPTH